jgi:hypothetical protein
MTAALSEWILEAALDVKTRVDEAFAEDTEPGGALSQLGLREVVDIVREHLRYGEPGVGFDHLMYVVDELDLVVSKRTLETIVKAGVAMNYDPATWAGLEKRSKT